MRRARFDTGHIIVENNLQHAQWLRAFFMVALECDTPIVAAYENAFSGVILSGNEFKRYYHLNCSKLDYICAHGFKKWPGNGAHGGETNYDELTKQLLLSSNNRPRASECRLCVRQKLVYGVLVFMLLAISVIIFIAVPRSDSSESSA
jgi:hypothetical protein